jgi:signal transduction histidine kinase
MRPFSFLPRWAAVLTVVAVILLQAVLGVAALTWLLHEQVSASLQQEADGLAASIVIDRNYRASLPAVSSTSAYQKPGSGLYYAAVIGKADTGQQQFKSPSLGNGALPLPGLAEGAVDVSRLDGPGSQPLLVTSKGYLLRGMPLTVSIARDMSSERPAVGTVALPWLALNTLILLAGGWLLWRTFQRILRPVADLQWDLKELVEGNPAVRGQGWYPDVHEIQRLVQLTTHRLERSRSAISSLAHLLKTPLAAIMQIANNPELKDIAEVRKDLLTHAELMQTSIQHKLKHAQLSGAGSKEAPFNPHVELQGMLQALRAIYRDKNIQYEVDVPDLEFLIDRQDCLELLGNLLDNASKWARQRVRLRMQLQGNGLNLIVEDDGPGCSDAELKILSEPGIWLNKTHGGHGLGMSLIRSIVALYSGKLSFARSPSLGGLQVDILMPCYAKDPASGAFKVHGAL